MTVEQTVDGTFYFYRDLALMEAAVVAAAAFGWKSLGGGRYSVWHLDAPSPDEIVGPDDKLIRWFRQHFPDEAARIVAEVEARFAHRSDKP